MKIYVDVSCLNRPFDDQGQVRIRLEAEATTAILDKCEQGEWQQVSSQMAKIYVFLSCDDRLVKLARRRRAQINVQVANPLDWLKEIGHDDDA